MTSNRDTSTVIIAVVITGSTTRCDVKAGEAGRRYAGCPDCGLRTARPLSSDARCAPVAAQDLGTRAGGRCLALGSPLPTSGATSRANSSFRELRSGPTFTPTRSRLRASRAFRAIVVPRLDSAARLPSRLDASWRFTTRTARTLGAMSTLAMMRHLEAATGSSSDVPPPSSPATSSCASSPRRIRRVNASRDPRWSSSRRFRRIPGLPSLTPLRASPRARWCFVRSGDGTFEAKLDACFSKRTSIDRRPPEAQPSRLDANAALAVSALASSANPGAPVDAEWIGTAWRRRRGGGSRRTDASARSRAVRRARRARRRRCLRRRHGRGAARSSRASAHQGWTSR